MDRVNISFSALQMTPDLHFSSSVYGFGAGLVAVGLSIVYLLLLPDGIGTAKWVTDEEREWLRAWLSGDDAATGEVRSGPEVMHALRQTRVWVLGIFLLSPCLAFYGFTFS